MFRFRDLPSRGDGEAPTDVGDRAKRAIATEAMQIFSDSIVEQKWCDRKELKVGSRNSKRLSVNKWETKIDGTKGIREGR